MIPVMYLFGRKLFGKKFYAFCAAFLMMFDFMHFGLTRISTIDVYGTFFVILMYYFMYDYFNNKSYNLSFNQSLKPLFFCGLVFGMGAASKWIGLYAGGGLALLFFLAKYYEYKDYVKLSVRKKSQRASWTKDFIPIYINRTMLCCVLFFIIIPGIIYVLSYIPYMMVPGPGHGFDLILRNQAAMYKYHSHDVLGATHPFSSYWWEWPLMRRPLETYLGSDLTAGMSSSMTLIGNPAIWWVGIAAVIAAVIIALSKCDKKMTVVFVAMAFQYLTWVGVTRIVFIYHFFSSLPFVIFSIVYVIKSLMEKYPEAKYVVYVYLAVVLLLFVMFYPVLSGMEVSRSFVENYLLWFKGRWVF
jgi:dolichyl-phosphate-mannose-protein mannosyltransferase